MAKKSQKGFQNQWLLGNYQLNPQRNITTHLTCMVKVKMNKLGQHQMLKEMERYWVNHM